MVAIDRLELLDNTLKKVIDWLRFAEAKNGALVAVGSATIFGVIRMLLSQEGLNGYITAYAMFYLIFVTSAVVIALISFVPRLEPPFWVSIPEKSENDNPLFFGHAGKYSKKSYLEIFNKYLGGQNVDQMSLELAICDQIVTNSRIAIIKYGTFDRAIYLFLAGILTPIGALLWFLVRK